MNEIRKAPVEHVLWGEGHVVKKSGNVISVRFATQGVKDFLYPDAFDRFLTMKDPGHSDRVLADLSAKKEADARKIAEEAREQAQAEKRAALETALLSAQKRKARTSTRKKTAPASQATPVANAANRLS